MAKDKAKVKGKKKLKALEKETKVGLHSIGTRFEALYEEQPASDAPAPKHSAAPALPSIPDDDELVELAELFKSLSDPTRLRILFLLAGGDKCVADISEAAGVSQSATSHQLRGMRQAGMVKFKRLGKQVFYSLADEDVRAMISQGLAVIE